MVMDKYSHLRGFFCAISLTAFHDLIIDSSMDFNRIMREGGREGGS